MKQIGSRVANSSISAIVNPTLAETIRKKLHYDRYLELSIKFGFSRCTPLLTVFHALKAGWWRGLLRLLAADPAAQTAVAPAAPCGLQRRTLWRSHQAGPRRA